MTTTSGRSLLLCLQCPGGAFTPDIQTTKEFPDDVVTFVRNHPVMFNPIYPVGRRPLVVRTNANYKYTSVAVDQVMAADGNYQVLFLGTGAGDHSFCVLTDKYKKSLSLQQHDLSVSRCYITERLSGCLSDKQVTEGRVSCGRGASGPAEKSLKSYPHVMFLHASHVHLCTRLHSARRSATVYQAACVLQEKPVLCHCVRRREALLSAEAPSLECFCPSRSPRPPRADLKGFHSRSCPGWFCPGYRA